MMPVDEANKKLMEHFLNNPPSHEGRFTLDGMTWPEDVPPVAVLD